MAKIHIKLSNKKNKNIATACMYFLTFSNNRNEYDDNSTTAAAAQLPNNIAAAQKKWQIHEKT
jgi:hypothetical protein